MSRFFQCRNSEGFAMVAVLLALLILIALGALIFTMATQDIRATTRVVGEKKSESAAESALGHALTDPLAGPGSSTPGDVNDPTTWPQVNAANDPDTRYFYTISPTATGCRPVVWSDLSKYMQQDYAVTAFGANTRFQSRTVLQATMGVFVTGSCDTTMP